MTNIRNFMQARQAFHLFLDAVRRRDLGVAKLFSNEIDAFLAEQAQQEQRTAQLIIVEVLDLVKTLGDESPERAGWVDVATLRSRVEERLDLEADDFAELFRALVQMRKLEATPGDAPEQGVEVPVYGWCNSVKLGEPLFATAA